jgi:hypothetical protein
MTGKGKGMRLFDGKIGLFGIVVAGLTGAVILAAAAVIYIAITAEPGCSCISVPSVDVVRVNDSYIYVKIMGGETSLLINSTAPGWGSLNVTIGSGQSAAGVEVSNYAGAGEPICGNRPGSYQYFAVPLNSTITVVGKFVDGTEQVLWNGEK